MAGRLATGAVSRAVRSIMLDPAVALEERRAGLGVDELGEIEQQYQLPVEGAAVSIIAWSERDLRFDVEFYNATGQRDSPYTLPHFTYGAVITSILPVLVTAVVREWFIREDDAVTGCRIAIGACNPGGDLIPFDGYVHATFQGFGAPAESGAELDSTGG